MYDLDQLPNDSNYSLVASECCLISYFDVRKFWWIFVLAILKANSFSHHLYKCNFIQNLNFYAFLYINETTPTNFSKISSHNLHNVYNKVTLKLSLRLIHCNILKFQDKPALRTCQKSALHHSLFWRYANFSKNNAHYTYLHD